MPIKSISDWNGAPDALVFGVEQEHFIFNQDGSVPSSDQMQSVFAELIRRGYVAKKLSATQRVLQVNKDIGEGFVSVKNDFCTHLIEAAFPPCRSADEFKAIYKDVWSDVSQALDSQGIQIRLGGWLGRIPEPIVRKEDGAQEWIDALRSQVEHKAFTHANFGARSCASQIHFNILNDDFYKNLSRLYALDYLVPLLFSNSKCAESEMGALHCARSFLFEHNIPQTYLTRSIPREIPSTQAEYEALKAGTPLYKKDLSNISPRVFGTVEFRTGCSQDTVDGLLDMIALRMAIVLAAQGADKLEPRNIAETFFEASRSGGVAAGLLNRDIELIRSHAKRLPTLWDKRLREALAGRGF